MKAIIPVAGAGTRLRPHTYTQPKALIPVAGKPILSLIVDQLVNAGCKEFVFIIGHLGDKIQDFILRTYPNINSHFILQNTREGIAHALWVGKDLIGDKDEVFIVLGDTVFDFDLKPIIDSEISCLGIKKVDDPRGFGVAEINNEGIITRVVEKPQMPKSNMALVGLYKIRETDILFEGIEYNINNKIKTNDEYQLTDALMYMIDKGIKFKGFKVDSWYDCGKKHGLLHSNAVLLKKWNRAPKERPEFYNTIIIDPVSISDKCKISNSIIGPNVTIGENCNINYSIIKESIIGSYAEIHDTLLHHSVIGSDAFIKGISQSLNLGDNTEIDFS